MNVFPNWKRHIREHPMSFRMLGYVIAFSSAFTLLGASIQLYWEYRTEIQRIEDTLLQVSTSHRSGLSTSLWLLDETQIRGQLEGILNLPDITYVEIRTPEGDLFTPDGTFLPSAHVYRLYPLSHVYRGEAHPVGNLHMAATLEGVRSRLLNRFMVTLFTQGLRTFATSLFILFVVQYMFTRHLKTLASHADRLNLNQLLTPLALDRRSKGFLRPDELDDLVSAMEEMRRRLAEDMDTMDRARSERERLIRDLEAKNTEMEQFTYTVSHDLKSPLVTIQNFLGLIQRDLDQGKVERARKDLQRVSGASQKMFQLLEDLLTLSRAGRLIGRPQPVDMGVLAFEVVELLSGPIAEAGVEVHVASDFPQVYGDALRLRTLLQNLIENSIKFSSGESSPRIAVGWRPAQKTDAEVEFLVRDNGRGISRRDQQQIFDLFNKLDVDSKGSGIGLALAQRIVTVHQGEMWVESDGVGQGSTFCFTVPLDPVTSPGVEEAPQPEE